MAKFALPTVSTAYLPKPPATTSLSSVTVFVKTMSEWLSSNSPTVSVPPVSRVCNWASVIVGTEHAV